MSNEYPPPGPGPEPADQPGQSDPPPPPPSSQPQWNPQSPGTPGYGQQPYGQPAYGQPPSYPPQQPGAPGGFGQPPRTAPLAIVSLVLGILGLPCCTLFVLGIAAAVTGFIARSQIDASQGRLKGNGMAMAGLILGIVSVLASLVYWILALTGVIDTNFNVSA